jgi:hypothetical protein
MANVWDASLPSGYSPAALFLRRWMLDMRLRVAGVPLERARLLEGKIREFHHRGKPGTVPGSRANEAFRLAKSVNG